MAEIEITIRAEEDDLREFAEHWCSKPGFVSIHASVVADAIAAALPKPRIAVKPGMVLRSKSDGWRTIALGQKRSTMTLCLAGWGLLGSDNTVDPDEWEVILDVD